MNKTFLDKLINSNIDIDYRYQQMDENKVLFYYLNNNPDAEKLFIERLSSIQYKYVFTNRKTGHEIENLIICDNEDDFFETQKYLCDQLYPIDQNKKIIAITGTNGKTTSCDLCRQILNFNNIKTFSVGTLGVVDKDDKILDFGMTSPPYILLRRFLFQYFKDHDACVMEVSSHALEQKRVYKIVFDSVGWTSFSQDHLDYHKDMNSYFQAKTKIFKHSLNQKCIVSAQNKNLIKTLDGFEIEPIEYKIHNDENPFFKLKHNRENLDVAIGVSQKILNTPLSIDIKKLKAPKGRFEYFEHLNKKIVIDYAHTPDAIEKISKELKECFAEYKVWIVFGCGGDRDRSKRSKMFESAKKYADLIFVTSDNPRSEYPEQIIDDIVQGQNKSLYRRNSSRKDSIIEAFCEMDEKTILLIAGKGHENYQEIDGVKHPFCDRKTIEDIKID